MALQYLMASIARFTDKNLDSTNLHFVSSKLSLLAVSEDRWKEFGRNCGLHPDKLDEIEENAPSVSDCFKECVKCWLEDDVDEVGKRPTLLKLAAILEETGEKDAAKEIRKYALELALQPVSTVFGQCLTCCSMPLLVFLAIFTAVILACLAAAPTGVTNQYAVRLREKYNEALMSYKDPDIFPTAGPSVHGYAPFITLVPTIGKKHGKDFLHSDKFEKNTQLKKIQIDNIFKPLTHEPLRFVLIEGEPGIGKSTLAKELVLRWVRGTDKFLNDFKVVSLIPLHLETYQKAKTIADLLIDVNDIDMTKITSLIKRKRGAGVLWILDGFDALPRQLRNSSTSIIIKLIKGDILFKSTVIVTSRHAATEPLLTVLEDDSKHIVLKGFGPNEILEYASKYFKNDTKVSEFHSYYSRNAMIESMLYNPMNCFIMCTIFDSFIIPNDKESITLTGIYNHYVRVLLKRHLIDAKVIDIHDDYDIPQHLIQKVDFDNPVLHPIWKDFHYLSKIAFGGVMKQEYVFGKKLRDVSKLSMMDTISSFTGFDKDESSSFIHTTLQEYFAAIYLVNNPGSMFTKKDLEQNSNLEVVLTFYVGLLKFLDRKVDDRAINLVFYYRKGLFDFDTDYKNTKMTVKSSDYPDHGHFYELVRHDLSDETPYTVLTSSLLRCIYEHDSLLNSTAFLRKKYKLAHVITTPQLFISHSPEIRARYVSMDSDYFIFGYIAARHNITIKLEPHSSSDLIAFKKGLQSHYSNVKGKIIIKIGNRYSSRDILTELLAVQNMISGLYLKSLDDASICQIISKFSSLEEISLNSFDNSYCVSNPLLQLKNLKKLTVKIGNVHETVVNLLKQLTDRGQPLKQLRVRLDDAENIQILKLIEMQFSLEELKIEVSQGQKFLWHARDKSLTVTKFTDEMLDLCEKVGEIKLSSFTSFIFDFINKKWQPFEVTMSSKKASNLCDFITIFERDIYTYKKVYNVNNPVSKIIFEIMSQEVFSDSKILINDLMDVTISPITDQNLIFYYFYYQP